MITRTMQALRAEVLQGTPPPPTDLKSTKFSEMKQKFPIILSFPSKALMSLLAFKNTWSLHMQTSLPMTLSLVVNMCTRNYFGTRHLL